MHVKRGLFGLLLLLVLVVSACGGAALAPEAPVKGAEAMVEETAPEATMEKDAAGTVVETGSSDAMTDLPDWFGAQLTDVRTGETLTVAGLKGKVMLVETMAIWCPKCLRQQQEVRELHEALGEWDDLVTLVLDVDPNEDAGDLKAYATKNGFTWTYAVAPPEVAREIGQRWKVPVIFLNPVGGSQLRAEALLAHAEDFITEPTFNVGDLLARVERVLERLQPGGTPTATQGLTGRQRQILPLLAEGLTDAEIGGILGLTERTVKHHIQEACRRLDASGRAHLVSIALRQRLIPCDPPRDEA